MILLLDEHFPQDLAEAIRRKRPGCSISSVHERDLDGLLDPALIEILDQEKTTLVTRDVNSLPRIIQSRLAAGQTHGGIIYVSRAIRQNNLREVIRRLLALIDKSGGEDWRCREEWL